MKKNLKTFVPLVAFAALFASCSNNDGEVEVAVTPDQYTVPSSYEFYRNGNSSVNLIEGNRVYLNMKDLDDNAKAFKTLTKAALLNLYEAKTNGATNSLKELTASSKDYFSGGNAESKKIQDFFLAGLNELADISTTSKDVLAGEGVAGTVESGKRIVNKFGIENSQIVQKGLMGAIMLDQIFNHHLGDGVLKDVTILSENNKKTLVAGTNYTRLENHWDTAYGILGVNKPNDVNSFWAGYLSKELTNIPEMKGIKEDIEKAFITGRAAATAKDYKVMQEQAGIIREKLSLVAAVRAVHYLNTPVDISVPSNSFHAWSEGYGFVYALQFSRKKDGSKYVTYDIVDGILKDIRGTKGFWDIDKLSKDANTKGSLKYAAKQIGEIYNFDYTKP